MGCLIVKGVYCRGVVRVDYVIIVYYTYISLSMSFIWCMKVSTPSEVLHDTQQIFIPTFSQPILMPLIYSSDNRSVLLNTTIVSSTLKTLVALPVRLLLVLEGLVTKLCSRNILARLEGVNFWLRRKLGAIVSLSSDESAIRIFKSAVSALG